ncbi:MAG: cytochrome c [Gammaproteobacteria bacterium]|nr:cytochrome c [Gammaproteobacteria bacterium]MBU1414171.1 cytochrome c [Gammaproteobacteria bacterium]
MKSTLIMAVALGGLLFTALAGAQMGGGMGPGMGQGMGRSMMGRGPEGVSIVRHRFVMANGIDKKYAGKRNPLALTDDNLRAGKALFDTNCVVCHGTSGKGDGPGAKGLNPAPADLTAAIAMPIAGNAYLDWTLSEGGVPVGSAMPPFKASLSEEDIWKLVLYLRSL